VWSSASPDFGVTVSSVLFYKLHTSVSNKCIFSGSRGTLRTSATENIIQRRIRFV
jgi:hypothetical protein